MVCPFLVFAARPINTVPNASVEIIGADKLANEPVIGFRHWMHHLFFILAPIAGVYPVAAKFRLFIVGTALIALQNFGQILFFESRRFMHRCSRYRNAKKRYFFK